MQFYLLFFLSGIYCRLYCYAQKHVKNIRAVTRPIDLPDGAGKKKSMKQKNKALHIHLHNHHSSPYHVSFNSEYTKNRLRVIVHRKK